MLDSNFWQSIRTTSRPIPIDPRLSRPIETPSAWHEISPSKSNHPGIMTGNEADGTLRGLVIHRLLQLATTQPSADINSRTLCKQAAHEHGLSATDARLDTWWKEVAAILENSELNWLMSPDSQYKAYNEVAIEYRSGKKTVYGIIDRLLVGPEQLYLVDYKTHRLEQNSAAQLVEQYRQQLALYREGLKRLWPEHKIHSFLLLTESATLMRA